jgi:hypothetical protein
MAVDAPPNPQAAFVEQCLAQFKLDPENRDVALATCLYHLETISHLVNGLMANPALRKMAGSQNGR